MNRKLIYATGRQMPSVAKGNMTRPPTSVTNNISLLTAFYLYYKLKYPASEKWTDK